MGNFKKSAELAFDRLGIHPTTLQSRFLEEYLEEIYNAGRRYTEIEKIEEQQKRKGEQK